MSEIDKKTIFTSLQKCEAIVQDNLKTVGEAFEAEERSKNNELLAVELMEFGTHVADVAAMAQAEKDHVEQMFEHMKLELMESHPEEEKFDIDQQRTRYRSEKVGMPANKAESTVKTDLSYIEALNQQRSLEKSKSVLTRKEKSLYAILDQSRSRYSLVNKDRTAG